MQTMNTEISLRIEVSQHKSKLVPLILSFTVLGIFLASSGYFYLHTIINDGVIREISPGEGAYQIEQAVLEDDLLQLAGWCFLQGMDLSSERNLPAMRIILASADDYDTRYYYSVDYGFARPEVDAYYREEKDSTHCGFYAQIELDKLDLYQHTYEIFLQPDQNNKLLIRPKLFLNEKGIYPSKQEYEEPDVDGTDLEQIVREGKLRSYRPEFGMYIYQYDWKIYLLADARYPFDKGWTNYGFNVVTNRQEMLSKERQEYGFENLGWDLLDTEITELIDAGRYRVFVKEIPCSYPVWFIDVGNWISGEGWSFMDRICPGIMEKVDF